MKTQMKFIALLPMKAHSARVKQKNFRTIAGKPLYRWILEALLAVDEIDSIVINTDARETLVASGLTQELSGGRIVIRDRRPDLCGDFVSMNLVLADDIQNTTADHYFMTHTTNPLLAPKTINAMIKKYVEGYREGSADSLFTVNRLQTRFYTTMGEPINHDPNNLIRTQDLEPYFEENSVGYFFSRDSFSLTNARIGKKPILYTTPRLESVDIDEPSDWFIAESLLRRVAAGEALPES